MLNSKMCVYQNILSVYPINLGNFDNYMNYMTARALHQLRIRMKVYIYI